MIEVEFEICDGVTETVMIPASKMYDKKYLSDMHKVIIEAATSELGYDPSDDDSWYEHEYMMKDD